MIKNRREKYTEFTPVKNGKAAAYTIVRAPDPKNCILEIICAARSKKNTGAILPPLLGTIRAMWTSGAQTARFAIYEKNTEAMPLATKSFGELINKHSVRNHYIYVIPPR